MTENHLELLAREVARIADMPARHILKSVVRSFPTDPFVAAQVLVNAGLGEPRRVLAGWCTYHLGFVCYNRVDIFGNKLFGPWPTETAEQGVVGRPWLPEDAEQGVFAATVAATDRRLSPQ